MPRGNKDINKYGFKTDRDDAYTENLGVRVSKKMMDALNQQENKAEFIRQAIQEKLDKLNQA